MKKSISLFTAVLIAFIVASGCKPTSKNELKYQRNNQDQVKLFMQKYPAFQPFLQKISNDSAKAFAEAKKLKKEEKKAEAMKKANEIITDDKLYSKIRSYYYKRKDLYKKKGELSRIISSKYSYMIDEGVNNANRALRKSANKMNYANTESKVMAVEEADKAYSIVYDAYSDVDRRIKRIKKKKKKRY